jgi:3D (Asp-Asp-Asp) domain-containing protein
VQHELEAKLILNNILYFKFYCQYYLKYKCKEKLNQLKQLNLLKQLKLLKIISMCIIIALIISLAPIDTTPIDIPTSMLTRLNTNTTSTTSNKVTVSTHMASRGNIDRNDRIDKPIDTPKVKSDIKSDVQYIDSFVGNVTMYTLHYLDCGKTSNHKEYGIGSSGIKVKANHTVAMASNIPYGTKIKIEGFDTIFTNEDTGSGVGKGCIDIFTNDRQSALKWGRQKRMVYVLSYGKR